MIWRHVTTDPQKRFWDIESIGSTLKIKLEEAVKTIDLSSYGEPMFPQVASNGVTALVPWKAHIAPVTGYTYLTSLLGRTKLIGSSYGNQCVKVEARGDGTFYVYFLEAGVHLTRCIFEVTPVTEEWPTGDLLEHERVKLPIPATIYPPATGMLEVFRGQVTAWVATDSPKTLGGERVDLVNGAGIYKVGLMDPAQVAVYRDVPDGQFQTVWRADNPKDNAQLGAFIAVAGDQVRIAINAETIDRLYTQDDFQPFVAGEIPATVAPFTTERILGAYCFNAIGMPLWANVVEPIRPLGNDGTVATQPLSQYATLPVLGTIEYPFGTIGGNGSNPLRNWVYVDHFGWDGTLGDIDICCPQLYRGEGDGQWQTAWQQEVSRLVKQFGSRRVCPVVNAHRRYTSAGPTLSTQDVLDGLAYGAALVEQFDLLGMIVFRVGTTDYAGALADELLSRLEVTNTLPDLPEPEPPDPIDPIDPEHPPMAETETQAHDRCTIAAYAVIGVKQHLEDGRLMKEAGQAALEAIGATQAQIQRYPSNMEVMYFTEARLTGVFWAAGMPAGDPNWRPAYDAWIKTRAV